MKKKPRNFSGNIAVLDIGSSKLACFIARLDVDGILKISGIGHQLSKGIRLGHIVDIIEAETSVIAAVHAAEQMADETIDNVVVNLAGSGIVSHHVTVELSVSGMSVGSRDLQDIIAEGKASVENDDNEAIHCFAINYTLDDVKNIRDPRGMLGERLSAELHIITAPLSMIRNISNCLAHCHLNIADFVVSPHASAIACLEQDEMDLGVTLLDMGGGVTNITVFVGGKNVFTDIVPIGGSHVTGDLAKGLSTSIAHAERLKTLHGSTVPSSLDDQAMIDVPQLGEEDNEDGSNLIPRSMLVGIIRPRMEELFEIIRNKLEVAGMDVVAGRRVVITGGASQLLGTRELATRILGKQVRLAKPKPIVGLADAVSGAAFSTPIGMIEYARRRMLEERRDIGKQNSLPFLSRTLRWVKENF